MLAEAYMNKKACIGLSVIFILAALYAAALFTACKMSEDLVPTYTVLFEANGGTGDPVSQTLNYGMSQRLNSIADIGFTHSLGYEFVGWAENPGGDVLYADKQIVTNLTETESKTLYARWGWIVEFVTSPGSSIPDRYVFPGGKAAPPQTPPTRAGYNFEDWFSTDPQMYPSAEKYSFTTTNVNGHLILYAKWVESGAATLCTVTYDSNGGGTPPSPRTVDYNTDINLPGAGSMAKAGSTFIGWRTEADNLVLPLYTPNDEFRVVKTITLYAQWTNAFAVLFDLNGGAGTVPATQTGAVYTRITLPTQSGFENPGYTLFAWNTDKNGDPSSSYNPGFANYFITETVTLYAIWNPITYNIRYDKNASDATGSMPNTTGLVYNVSGALTANDYKRKGYTFREWATGADGSGAKYSDGGTVEKLSTTQGETVPMYAQWKPNTYTVKYDKNAADATGTMDPSSHIYDEAKNLSLNKFTRSGFNFKYWTEYPGDTGTHYADTASVKNLTDADNGIFTLYAQWTTQVNAQLPNISIHPQSKTYVMGDSVTALTVTAASPEGGSLTYQWYSNTSNSNTGGTILSDETSVNYTPPVTAVGTKYYYVVITNKISDNEDGGIKSAEKASNAAVIEVKALVHAATPSISSHPQGATYNQNAAAADLKVTASITDSGSGGSMSYQWYSHTSNSNSGGSSLGSTSGAQTASYTPGTATPGTRYYYVEVTNTNNSVTGNKIVTAMSNAVAITVKAIYTVSFNSNGGSVVTSQQVVEGGTATKPSDPTRSGYRFDGWYNENLSATFNLSAPITGNTTITAKWLYEFTVVYNVNWPSITDISIAPGSGGSTASTTHVESRPLALRPNGFACRGHEFAGWATTPGGGVTYTNGQTVTLSSSSDVPVPLYAVWTRKTIPSPSTLAAGLDWIEENAVNGGRYRITISGAETIAPRIPSTGTGFSSYEITLHATAARSINLASSGSMFTITEGVKLVLGLPSSEGSSSNITLRGRTDNNAPVIKVKDGGQFEMNAGTVSGNTIKATQLITANAAGIQLEENRSSGAMGGTTFTMNGGTISGNTSQSSYGGGVSISGSCTFTMTGGTISGNTAKSGGGVSFGSGVFTKTGCIIYGNDGGTNSNTATDATSPGHAAYSERLKLPAGIVYKIRNSTAYAGDNLNSTVDGAPGGWEN